MIQQIVGVQAGCPYTAFISNETQSSHFHSELDILYVLKGKLSYLLGDTQYALKSRDFIFANPYEIHAISAVSDDCCYVHIQIQESRFRTFFASTDMLQFSWQESLNNRREPLYAEVADSIRNIVMEGTNRENDYIAKSFQQIMRILLALHKWCPSSAAADNGGKKSSNQQQKSSEIMDYINSHYKEQISLDTISKALFLSPPYISKIFKENFQIGVLEYTNRLRVERSIQALSHSNALIADIAEECGFTNAKTFSRIFQKEMGISPTDYRKQHSTETHTPQMLFPPVKPDFVELLDLEGDADFLPTDNELNRAQPISYDFTQSAVLPQKQPWNRILYAGTAELLLHSKAQQIVSRAVKDFGFEYIRFMGAFSDGMQSYQEDENGNPRYFWMLLDEVIHFVLEQKTKPFIGLGYMPSKLAAATPPSPFYWKANTSAIYLSFPRMRMKNRIVLVDT